MEEYKFPSIYSFPPFYTKQPNQETFASQKQQWQNFILSYCKHHKLYKIPLTQETLATPLFRNETINRTVKMDLLKEVMDDMTAQKSAEYTTKKKDEVLIFWRTPDEWANLMTGYITETGQTGTVMTNYDVTEEGTLGEDFKNMDLVMLRRIIEVLTKRGKAAIMKDSNGDEQGVKFF